MKTSLKLWVIAFAMALFTVTASAVNPTNAPTASKSWWTDFSVSPYGTFKHPDFGKPVWGAGLDIGYNINRVVSVHFANSVFDYECIDWFEHSAIDETELLFRADLIKTGGAGRDRLVGYVIGGGSRDWEAQDWGFGVGIGAELRFSKNVSVGVDSRIRAWFDQDKDLITRGFVSIRF